MRWAPLRGALSELIKAIYYRSSGQEKWEPRSGEPVFRPDVRPTLSCAFDFDPNTLGGSQGLQLFHPHPHGAHPVVLETGGGDAFGQGFGQPDMALGDDGADAFFDHMIRSEE